MKRFVLFIPSLLAVFPSLFIFFKNKDVIDIPFYIILFLLFGIGTTLFLCLLIFKFFIKNDSIAVVMSVIAVLAVFYYGYFYEIIITGFGNFSLNRHIEVILIWSGCMISLWFLAWRIKKNADFLCKIICIFTMVLFTVFLIFIAVDNVQKILSKNSKIISMENAEEAFSLDYVNSFLGYAPDVYYIVPDGYENASVLEKFFGYDNREFFSHLEQKGFVIIKNSESNYPNTLFSMPATLNMEYMDKLIADPSLDSLLVRKKIFEKSNVSDLFENFGYQYVAIASDNTSFSGDEADVRFGPNLLFRLFIKPTIFDPFSRRFRSRILNAFNSFNEASALSSPKFVLAHIIALHDPYVFGPNGERIGINTGAAHSENDMKLYLGQLKFVNKELERAIDVILKNSIRPPIIIIQSDHGVSLPDSYGAENVQDARLKNLSAFLLPKKAENLPSSNINTFRFIFDYYFGTSFGLLENKKK